MEGKCILISIRDSEFPPAPRDAMIRFSTVELGKSSQTLTSLYYFFPENMLLLLLSSLSLQTVGWGKILELSIQNVSCHSSNVHVAESSPICPIPVSMSPG